MKAGRTVLKKLYGWSVPLYGKVTCIGGGYYLLKPVFLIDGSRATRIDHLWIECSEALFKGEWYLVRGDVKEYGTRSVDYSVNNIRVLSWHVYLQLEVTSESCDFECAQRIRPFVKVIANEELEENRMILRSYEAGLLGGGEHAGRAGKRIRMPKLRRRKRRTTVSSFRQKYIRDNSKVVVDENDVALCGDWDYVTEYDYLHDEMSLAAE